MPKVEVRGVDETVDSLQLVGFLIEGLDPDQSAIVIAANIRAIAPVRSGYYVSQVRAVPSSRDNTATVAAATTYAIPLEAVRHPVREGIKAAQQQAVDATARQIATIIRSST